jgi:hypothetical protein
MIKTPKSPRYRRKIPQYAKAYVWKIFIKFTLNGDRLDVSLSAQEQCDDTHSTPLLNTTLVRLARAVCQDKESEDIQIGKEETSISSHRWPDLLTRNIKEYTKTLSEVENYFSKFVEHKIYIQKSIAILPNCNKQSKNESEKKNPFPIASKRVKYLEIIFTEVQNL